MQADTGSRGPLPRAVLLIERPGQKGSVVTRLFFPIIVCRSTFTQSVSVSLFCLGDVARCVVSDAIVLLRLSNHNGVDLDVSCAPFQIIVVFGVVLHASLISAESIQMSPAMFL